MAEWEKYTFLYFNLEKIYSGAQILCHLGDKIYSHILQTFNKSK